MTIFNRNITFKCNVHCKHPMRDKPKLWMIYDIYEARTYDYGN